jgi:hypothetical protein
MSEFLMEPGEQRYPPLLAAALALLPEALRLRLRDWVSPVVDLMHLAVVFAAAAALGLPPASMLIAGLVYAITPTLALEYATLNPRSLASLLFTAFMLCLFSASVREGWGWLAAGGLAGALLLLTNKMAAQMLALAAVGTAVAVERSLPLAFACLAAAVAIVLSGGFYRQVLRGHFEILRYYARHIPDLNRHQIYDSPIAPPGGPSGSRPLYEPGLKGNWRLARVLIANNPWMVLLPWAFLLAPSSPANRFLGLWAGLPVAAALVTTLVPPLRFLGQGFRYLKFGVFPLSLLIAQVFAGWPAVLWTVPPAVASLAVIARLQSARPLETIDDDLLRVMAFLRAHPAELAATIPTHRSGLLAFLGGKRVIGGGHGGGYRQLEVWAPVIRQPVGEILDSYGVRLLLVDTGFVEPADLRLPAEFREVLRRGRYVLLEKSPADVAGGLTS